MEHITRGFIFAAIPPGKIIFWLDYENGDKIFTVLIHINVVFILGAWLLSERVILLVVYNYWLIRMNCQLCFSEIQSVNVDWIDDCRLCVRYSVVATSIQCSWWNHMFTTVYTTCLGEAIHVRALQNNRKWYWSDVDWW